MSSRVQLAVTLLKGLDVMGCVASHPAGLTMKQLQGLVVAPRTTLLRLLRTLESYGLISHRHGFYVPTEKFHGWSRPDRYDALRSKFRPLLEQFARETGELVVLGVVEGRKLRHLDYIECRHQVVVHPSLRQRYMLEHTAMGKLVISVRPDLAARVRDPRLRLEIDAARRTGIAWNRGESSPGVIAVATWAQPAASTAAMISLSWPDFRFDERQALKAIARIQRLLKLD